MRTHYGPWQPCWNSNQHQKHKSGRGPSSKHFWQVWLKSVQRFQRRRFKCEKLTDGRRTLTHDKSSHGLWPGELKTNPTSSTKNPNNTHFVKKHPSHRTFQLNLLSNVPLAILFRPFDLLAPKTFLIIWFSKLSTLSLMKVIPETCRAH
jgi:hypothetical protein